MIKLVRSKKSHIDEIYEIEKMCFATPWSKKALYKDIIENVLAYYVTVLIKDTVVGYGGMWTVEDEAHITNIAVHEDYRGQKLGDSILNALIDRCEFLGIRYMSLEVRKGNTVALNLYKKHGFKVEGIRKKYYSDNNEDAYVMWKNL